MKAITIHREGNGKRWARFYVGINKSTGKPMRKYKTFDDALTDEECAKIALEERAKYKRAVQNYGDCTLRAMLTAYLESIATSITPNTYRSYAGSINRLGALGEKPFIQVTSVDIQNHYTWLYRHGGRKQKGLSGSTIKQTDSFLRSAFAKLYKRKDIDKDIMGDVTKPQEDTPDAVPLSPEDLSTLMSCMFRDGDSDLRTITCSAAMIAMLSGVREGEVCALTWGDVNLDSGLMTVSSTVVRNGRGEIVRQPKTKSKKTRRLKINDSLREIILAQKAWQQRKLSRITRDTPLISADGKFVIGERISREFKALLREAGLSEVYRFHSLRHTYASLPILKGVSVLRISDCLGHSGPEVTVRKYSHLLPMDDKDPGDVMSDLIGGLS